MNTILLITEHEPIQKSIHSFVAHYQEEKLSVTPARTVEESETILFGNNVALIVIEWGIQGAPEFIKALKNDEMFRLLPIIVLIEDHSEDRIKNVFSCGADNFFILSKDTSLLPFIIRPLINNNVLNSELVSKISELQEQAIFDFILLDLIKKYIPSTIWKRANDFAYEQKIQIHEEELELTIVFADIKEFTNMSQHLTPKQVITNLNSVFEIATKIVYENDGDVDKFIGDAFLGVFPDAKKAVKACMIIQKKIEFLNRTRKTKNLPPIQFRIGIHTGSVIRGNVGGHQRYDNTLIGDTVNTASRLEQMADPGGILISEATRKKAGIAIPASYQRTIQLKGKDKLETVYSIYEYLSSRIVKKSQ